MDSNCQPHSYNTRNNKYFTATTKAHYLKNYEKPLFTLDYNFLNTYFPKLKMNKMLENFKTEMKTSFINKALYSLDAGDKVVSSPPKQIILILLFDNDGKTWI